MTVEVRRLGHALGLAGVALLVATTAAHAHTDVESGKGFVTGFLHPLQGLDHFLAMLSVGIVSAQIGGRKIYTIPALFVIAMISGALAGIYGPRWSFVELGIALSVVVLGFEIVRAREGDHAWLVMAFVALFGSLHGHAHGLELPRTADPVYYAAGFVFCTAAIHLLGVGVGHWLMRHPRSVPYLRHIGSMMAGMGLMILFDVLGSR